jgi:hypothetical protein
VTTPNPQLGAPTAAQKAQAGSGLFVILMMIVLFAFETPRFRHFLSEQIYGAWSHYYIAPQLKAAEAAAAADQPEEALQLAAPILAAHPQDPRVLYFVAGTRLNSGDLVRGVFYAIAYLRSPHDKDSEQFTRLAQLLLADPAISGYFIRSNYAYGSIDPVVDSLPLDPVDKVHIKMLDPDEHSRVEPPPYAITRSLAQDVAFFYSQPAGWQHVVLLSPAQVLSRESSAQGGLWQLTPPKMEKGRTWGHEFPQRLYERAKLWHSIETAELAAAYAEDEHGGEGCCKLDLADPDLRPLDVISAEFVKEWAAQHKTAPEESAAGQREVLKLRERVLLKQLYLLQFAADASVRDD